MTAWSSMMAPEHFDAIIVGSGVAGGAAARELCLGGLRVLMLESGGLPSQAASQRAFSNALDYPVQSRCYAFHAGTSSYLINDMESPYGTDSDAPFSWIRARALGGKSLLWAGHCYRMGDLDFTAASQDGIGEDWPIRYEEIAPFYDEAERLLHVCDARNEPYGAEVRNLIMAERLQKAGNQGLKFAPARISDSRLQPRMPCIHCGSISGACVRPVTSRDSTLAAAFATGLLTLWTHAQVHTVTVNR